MKPKRIGFLGFEGMVTLDLVGPMDTFKTVCSSSRPLPDVYELIVIGLNKNEFRSKSGLTLRPDATIEEALELDTLIIPGGPGARVGDVAEKVCPWLVSVAPRVRRVASVCTGIYLLAPTGLLDGRQVTTHWGHVADVARRFPKLKLDPDALYIKSDKFYTSAGVTAGIDLSLALIEEDLGGKVALAVARDLVMYLKRTGGQRQYSEPLRLQSGSGDQFPGLMGWILRNLHEDLSVEALAAHTSLSRRHFTRLFREAFGASPSEVVEELRLDQARTLLLESDALIAEVAKTVGFRSPDSFRRAFSRRYGISPAQFRVPFGASVRSH